MVYKLQGIFKKFPHSYIYKENGKSGRGGVGWVIMFWDSQGPVLETYLECGTTVTSATYCEMLQSGPKPEIVSKRRGRLSEGILLLHDNAHPDIGAHMLETLRKLKWEVMEHPAHSSDLAPSDFHLFQLLKEALGGRRFRCDDIKHTVHQWLHAQPKTLYYDGIKKLVGCWEKCVGMSM
jgi:histone-lysine N-methyltransferase SETMAR